MTTRELLVHTTAKELGIPHSKVEKVCQSLSSYVTHLMEKGPDETIPLEEKYQAFRWPHVGVWRVKPMRAQKMGLELPAITPTKFMAAKLQSTPTMIDTLDPTTWPVQLTIDLTPEEGKKVETCPGSMWETYSRKLLASYGHKLVSPYSSTTSSTQLTIKAPKPLEPNDLP